MRSTSMLLTIKNLPFRPDYREHDGSDTAWFDRDTHIERYAALLDTLKSRLGDDWYRLPDEKAAVHLGSEMKRTVLSLIRQCSESCDHETTVDFITEGAIRKIQDRIASRPRQRVLKGDLKATGTVAHEHMCPNSEVFRCLTSTKFQSMNTAEILELLSFRALVVGPRTKEAKRWSEVDRLDSAFPDRVPKASDMKELVGKKVPLKYYPLLRYHKVGLLDALIPVTARARRLLVEYRRYMRLPPIHETDDWANRQTPTARP